MVEAFCLRDSGTEPSKIGNGSNAAALRFQLEANITDRWLGE